MQTPKARSGASEVTQRVSPTQKVTPSLKVSPTRKVSPVQKVSPTRKVSPAQKVSPNLKDSLRVVRRQLKPTPLETTDIASSSKQVRRLSKDRSPKVSERRSPRSPLPEQKKGPSRVSELESQISQLQDDLKKANNELQSSESCKKLAQQDAEESKQQVRALSSKLEETQQYIPDLCVSEEARVIKLQKISQERDQAWQSELESIQKKHSVDAAALSVAVDEIEKLKLQLETVSASEADQTKHAELVSLELQNLKENLAETLQLVENMKNELNDCKAAEVQAQAQVSQTLLQLESARRTVETLSEDGMKTLEAYNSVAVELDQSRARVNSLEEVVAKLKSDLNNVSSNNGPELEIGEKHESLGSNEVEAELYNLKSEVKLLKSTLETVEAKHREEQIQSTLQIRSAHELVDQMRSASGQREDELHDELQRTKAGFEGLKSHLMDKETELQCISEENEGLNVRLQQSLSCQREYELEMEVKELTKHVAELKAHLMDKETELQSISEENDIMRVRVNKSEMDMKKANEEVVAEVEAARCAEREAHVKLRIAMEEADKNSKKVARVTEQLEAAQTASAELEAELRRLKVQSDQWRKAAEAAAAILSSGNGKIMERTVSMDSNYHAPRNLGSPYAEDMDDETLKKKNGNMLKKIGVFWKKPQK